MKRNRTYIADSKAAKVVVYERVSTDKQETAQQSRTVNAWLKAHGMEATMTVAEEGVSGGVSYKDRKLGKVVLPLLGRGDALVVAEVSRLGRSMSDINKLVNDELKPKGVRLVVVQMGLDLDCANLKAIDEMILFAFGFAAQMEKELIQERTQSAINVRKDAIKANGSFVAKRSGRTVTKLGSPEIGKATAAAAAAKRRKAQQDANNVLIWSMLQPLEVNGNAPTTDALKGFVLECAEKGIKTATGKDMKVASARNCYYYLKRIFA